MDKETRWSHYRAGTTEEQRSVWTEYVMFYFMYNIWHLYYTIIRKRFQLLFFCSLDTGCLGSTNAINLLKKPLSSLVWLWSYSHTYTWDKRLTLILWPWPLHDLPSIGINKYIGENPTTSTSNGFSNRNTVTILCTLCFYFYKIINNSIESLSVTIFFFI